MNLLNMMQIIYTGRDAAGKLYRGTITLDRDQAPVAVGDLATATAGETISIDVLANDADPEGDALTVTSASATHGSVVIAADNRLSYTAPVEYVGLDTIVYTVIDPAGNTASASVAVGVETPPNAPPVAVDDLATATAGETISIDVLANDADPEGDALTVTSASATHGSVVIAADNRLSYTAPVEYVGFDTIVYTVIDPAGNTASASVAVGVETPPNTPPVAVDDLATATAGETISIDVLANDADPEGDALTVTSASATHGSVVIAADNRLSYTAPVEYIGFDTIVYTVIDPAGNTTSASVAVGVETPPNTPPVAVDDLATATAGETISIDVLANDADPEGDALTVTSASATHGSVVIAADNRLSYTAPVEYVGFDTIVYTVIDPAGNTASASVAVGVEAPPNTPPVAVDDLATATAGETISIDVLANDADPEGDALTVTSASATHGSVVIAADNRLSYTAPVEYVGFDTIVYTVIDPAGNTASASVAVGVEAPPLQLVIDQETSLGDFSVEADSGEIAITVLEPAQYAGTYVIQTVDLDGGPLNLLPPRIESDASGATLTAVPGIWVGEEAHGPIGFVQQWYRGTTPIAGATGSIYSIQPGDPASGLSYSRKATNTVGSRTVTVEALAATLTETQPQAFTEQGVRFSAPAKLVRSADLAPTDSQNVLWFVSLIPHATSRHGILRQTSFYNGVEIWDGRLQFRATMSGVSRVVNTRSLTAGRRVSILASASGSGGSTLLRLYSRFGDETTWTEEKSDSGASGPVDLTFGGFSVGGRHGSTGQDLEATVYRIAFWSDLQADIGSAGVQTGFLKADGTLEDPAVSRGFYGTPRVDLHGAAADYAAGINRGIAGNFDNAEGTFTNV